MSLTKSNLFRFGYLFLMGIFISIGCQQKSERPASDSSTVESTKTDPSPPATPESSVASSDDVSGAEDAKEVRHGGGQGSGGKGMGQRGGFRPDMTTIHAMFAASDKIQRTVKNLSDGAEATTESDDEKVADFIQEHVPAMERRVLESNPLPPMTFHPIFVNLIKHSKDYTLKFEDTERGVKVIYKANDPFVIMLVQEHAQLVSRFLKNGMREIHKPYTLPEVKADFESETTDPR